MELTRQRVLVIGGGKRIGAAIARRARSKGAEVIVGARNPDAIHDTARMQSYNFV